jgi:hypothetical protein
MLDRHSQARAALHSCAAAQPGKGVEQVKSVFASVCLRTDTHRCVRTFVHSATRQCVRSCAVCSQTVRTLVRSLTEQARRR